MTITEQGRRLLDELAPVLIEREKVWAAGIAHQDRQDLIRALGTLQNHLQSMSPES